MKQKPRKKTVWPVIAVCIFLTTIIWLVFGQTLRHAFINFDDDAYVYENPTVNRGFTVQGILWALTHVHASNWHPLTWISHMLDCQLYGLNPWGHHLTNVLLHTVTAISLFLILRQMTGSLWRSAFVAAVFAIHPLRVESVAWVTERKDVLSGLFFMLSIAAYIRYARHPWSPYRYGLVLLLFALGLMSKPMLVTLPFVLLLLDYWPLNRATTADERGDNTFRIWRGLLIEKLPLFGLAAASSLATLFAQTIAIRPLAAISLPLRLGNAAISCVAYLRQMFWPANLAVLYPMSAREMESTKVALSLLLLALISATVFVLRRHRYLVTGWIWYLIMLAPVIGILQVGVQARADRYTYLPQIGVYLLLAWAGVDLCGRWRHRRLFLTVICAAVLCALLFTARTQASYWRDSEKLWTHTLSSTVDNEAAHRSLGYVAYEKGRAEEAIAHYKEALRIAPDQAIVYSHLGLVFLQLNRPDEAVAYFEKALALTPDSAEAHSNLGFAFLQLRRFDESVVHLQKALEIKPDYADAHYNLGNTFLQMGRLDEALSHYNQALELNPKDAEVQNNMAWILATDPEASVRNGARAVELAEAAVSLTGNTQPRTVATLAAAYAEAGRFSDAVKSAQRALQLATGQGQFALADSIRAQLELYRSNLPYRSNRSSSVAP